MKIIKRSGKEDVFDRSKIIAAISKANITVVESEQLTPAQIEEIAQEITDTFLPKWQTLWDLLGCSETAPEPDREEVLEKLKQAEEDMRQW